MRSNNSNNSFYEINCTPISKPEMTVKKGNIKTTIFYVIGFGMLLIIEDFYLFQFF